jgi:hypothetical protein
MAMTSSPLLNITRLVLAGTILSQAFLPSDAVARSAKKPKSTPPTYSSLFPYPDTCLDTARHPDKIHDFYCHEAYYFANMMDVIDPLYITSDIAFNATKLTTIDAHIKNIEAWSRDIQEAIGLTEETRLFWVGICNENLIGFLELRLRFVTGQTYIDTHTRMTELLALRSSQPKNGIQSYRDLLKYRNSDISSRE